MFIVINNQQMINETKLKRYSNYIMFDLQSPYDKNTLYSRYEIIKYYVVIGPKNKHKSNKSVSFNLEKNVKY